MDIKRKYVFFEHGDGLLPGNREAEKVHALKYQHHSVSKRKEDSKNGTEK